MDNGWIKLHRKIIGCGFFNNPNLSHFWLWCLLKATHEEYEQVIGFTAVRLYPGQFIFGRKVAAEETGLSPQTIRTCTRTLISTRNITIQPTNKFSVITICNWAIYQNTETQTNQQTNQQLTNNQPTTNHKQEHKEHKEIRGLSAFQNEKPVDNFEMVYAPGTGKLVKVAKYADTRH